MNIFAHLNIWSFSRFLFLRVNPFWVKLCYFITISLLGYLALSVSNPKTPSSTPNTLDVFFTSVSAATDSSMSTLEMEVFSNTQLIIITILMFLGGEVFISMVTLHLTSKFKSKNNHHQDNNTIHNHTNSIDQVELDLVNNNNMITIKSHVSSSEDDNHHNSLLCNNSIRVLCYVILGYLVVIHVIGSSLVSFYITLVPSARNVLKNKDLEIQTFSIFTTVSTFANCGFTPTNENMIVFKKNSGLLLLLIPQILLGNTLYPTCLRFVIWVLKKVTKRVEFEYMLRNSKAMGYGDHLFSSSHHCCLLGVTAFGFLFVQFLLFCCLEWNSESMDGLSLYQKVMASLFQVSNSRYNGESVFDLSIISPAILVLFVVMMYLPPYTTFLPRRRINDERDYSMTDQNVKNKTSFVEILLFSQLSYLVIFIIIICITEREKMKDDPLNFNVLNIIIEVISAYGNVGFSTGYSCKRQLKAERSCKDTMAGFVGRWSTQGKVILIIVMFYGRLKNFNTQGGKAWKLF